MQNFSVISYKYHKVKKIKIETFFEQNRNLSWENRNLFLFSPSYAV